MHMRVSGIIVLKDNLCLLTHTHSHKEFQVVWFERQSMTMCVSSLILTSIVSRDRLEWEISGLGQGGGVQY